jgi:sulfoxide reductase heme-binding subunit YedZ
VSVRAPGQRVDASSRPAAAVRRSGSGQARTRLRDIGGAAGALAVSVSTGFVLSLHDAGLLHNRMLPWILGRSLGIATYVALSALVVLGIWFRHPWRVARRTPSPEFLLRAHVTLAACTVALLAGHVTALVLDRYSGVGWIGAVVPWHARYRPTGVALGSVALYGIVLVASTAALAGSIGRRVWLPVHSVSSAVFAASLAHGLLAGSDSHVLWWMYVVSGVLVATLQTSRLLTRRVVPQEVW